MTATLIVARLENSVKRNKKEGDGNEAYLYPLWANFTRW